MTIEQTEVIDLISKNTQKGYVSLIICDHLEWDEKNEKLLVLQDKINSYLNFAESGQIFEEYPSAIGNKINIELDCMYYPSEEGVKFLTLIKPVIEGAGLTFKWRVTNEESS